MRKNFKSEMIEPKVGSTLTENKNDFFFEVTMEENDKVYTMRKKVNDPKKQVVLFFFRDLCGKKLSYQEMDDFYFNYVVPNGLQSYVGELVTEMEHIIKNS